VRGFWEDPLPLPAEMIPRRSASGTRTASVAMKAFHRLCDADVAGLTTSAQALPFPVPAQYLRHARVTVASSAICLVLTPYGDVKVLRRGVPIAALTSVRWRLTELPAKYAILRRLVSNTARAHRFLTIVLNLSEARRAF
jgi:hypothetical protein